MVAVANETATNATPLNTKRGTYLHWCDPSGAELWLQVDRNGELIGMNPHFSGQATMPVGLQSRTDDTDHPLDGSFHAWANPAEGSSEDGDYPFLFDSPDAMTHLDLLVPSQATVQLAAFAHEVTFFDSEEAFDESQRDQEVKFAASSFIPSGLFSPEGEGSEAPSAMAIFTGAVLAAEKKVNAMSGNHFYWALVDTLGGRFDVVIDRTLAECAPPVGGILSGSFWLTGRLVEYQKRKSWLRSLLG